MFEHSGKYVLVPAKHAASNSFKFADIYKTQLKCLVKTLNIVS